MTNSIKLWVLAVAGTALLTNCANCKGGGGKQSFGEVRVLSFDAEGNPA